MIFSSDAFKKADGAFRFSGNIKAVAHPCLAKPIFTELFRGYAFRHAEISFEETGALMLSVGGASPLSLDGKDYAISITKDGFSLAGASEQDLIHAFFTLADRIYAEETKDGTELCIDCGTLCESAKIPVRMVHFCVFPETELWELARFVRLAAALKYTHLIVEFWGMLRYDCLAEMGWPSAYTKEELRPILSEAKALGLSLIPMLNHWGHATASRVMHGKHVVLDQNPALQTLFDADGWCWNIESPKTRALLRAARKELCELFGAGEYFHIGCDEAYNFDLTKKDNRDAIVSYLNEISEELSAMGRRAIMWGDMLLAPDASYQPKLYTLSPNKEAADDLLARISKHILIADWQYEPQKAPVETAAVFTRAGFDCMLCPYDMGMAPMRACTATAKDQALFGLLHTTWHTLSTGIPYVSLAAKGCFEDISDTNRNATQTATAALLRKIFPVGGDYRKSGFAKYQVDTRW